MDASCDDMDSMITLRTRSKSSQSSGCVFIVWYCIVWRWWWWWWLRSAAWTLWLFAVETELRRVKATCIIAVCGPVRSRCHVVLCCERLTRRNEFVEFVIVNPGVPYAVDLELFDVCVCVCVNNVRIRIYRAKTMGISYMGHIYSFFNRPSVKRSTTQCKTRYIIRYVIGLLCN